MLSRNPMGYFWGIPLDINRSEFRDRKCFHEAPNVDALYSLENPKNRTEGTSMKKLIFGICYVLFISAFAFAGDVKTAQVDVLTEASMSWDGRRLPDYPKGTPEITILRIKIPPGAELPLHEHPFINAGVLISGELSITTKDGRMLHLTAGEPIVEVVNKLHSGKNVGNVTAEILVFYAGVQGKPITVHAKDNSE